MNTDDKDKVNDPAIAYKRVHVYTGFEQQEDAERTRMHSLSSEERIRQAVIMIKKIYNYKGPTPPAEQHITIKKKNEYFL